MSEYHGDESGMPYRAFPREVPLPHLGALALVFLALFVLVALTWVALV